jgi:hypothetical protein
MVYNTLDTAGTNWYKESVMGQEGEWIKEHLREFADRLEQSVVERERERAVVICHAMRDVEYSAMEIAERIMGRE